MKNKSFNLVTEKWIPTTSGTKSLLDIFQDGMKKDPSDIQIKDYDISGSVPERVSILRLLLAITQASLAWKDNDFWEESKESFPNKVVEYLEKWKDRFDLYSEKYPFLQDITVPLVFPEAKSGGIFPVQAFDMRKSQGSTSTGFKSMVNVDTVTDADVAIGLITYLSYTIPSNGSRKTQTGPCIGPYGYLHTFWSGNSLINTIYANILVEEDGLVKEYKDGIGRPVWEGTFMPNSLIGNYVPVHVPVLLGDGVYYQIANGKDPKYTISGITNPTVCIKSVDNKGIRKFGYTDGNKRAWRELPSLLQFMDGSSLNGVPLIKSTHERAEYISGIKLSCLGLSCSCSMGYPLLKDDSIEVSSTLVIPIIENTIESKIWFNKYKEDIELMDEFNKRLRKAVNIYWGKLNHKKNGYANKAQSIWWERMEINSQSLIEGKWHPSEEYLLNCAREVFLEVCPTNTDRQLKESVRAEFFLSQSTKVQPKSQSTKSKKPKGKTKTISEVVI